MRHLLIASYIFFTLGTAAALAIGLVQIVNNVVGPNGYVLNDSAGFLRDDVDPANGKIFAR